MINKLKGLPVPILPTLVGACTLANVLNGFEGFSWVRNVTFVVTTIVWCLYVVKIICHFETCKNEYLQTVPSSLYAGFTMLMMLMGSFYFPYNEGLGKGLWLAGIVIHAIHICIFTYRNIITGRNWDTTVPSWFVTYNGIMVSAVVGAPMGMPTLCKIITIYGIIIFTALIPFMIYRLIKYPIKPGMYHTQAILLAPSSLCVVCYLTHFEGAIQPFIIYYLYMAVILALLFICIKLPSFFDVPFYPGFAGLTFPMAIGIVATAKFCGYATNAGMENIANILTQVKGFQIYFTCGLIFYVLLNFVRLWVNSYKK